MPLDNYSAPRMNDRTMGKLCRPWVLFGSGLVLLAVVCTIDACFGPPRSMAQIEPFSTFAGYFMVPLLVLSFFLCFMSPFTSSLSSSKKVAVAFAGAIFWVLALCLAAGILLYFLVDVPETQGDLIWGIQFDKSAATTIIAAGVVALVVLMVFVRKRMKA
jgi:hypothetical protein